MGDSILNEIKKLLGLDEAYEAFDLDVKIHINSAFSALTQIGATPPEGFVIVDKTTTWQELYNDIAVLEMIKTFVYLKVRLVFDPPSTSFVISAIEKQIEELSYRLRVLEHIFNPVVESNIAE